MNVGAVLREKREEVGLTQPELARKVGVSESTIRMYELGLREVPHDVADRAAAVLRAPEICFARCQECPSNWLSIGVMLVDTHPIVEVQAAIEEATEAIEAVSALNLRNKTRLDPAEQKALERAIDQMLDLIPVAATAVASWCRTYGLDMRAIQKRHLRKLQARGYLQGGEWAA